ncbi:hypothetical protein M0802_003343 [Mischocyttarus mexicanus]|nr:hypothetical protein M0802_003343 [Mischocyttarus mexicanus]
MRPTATKLVTVLRSMEITFLGLLPQESHRVGEEQCGTSFTQLWFLRGAICPEIWTSSKGKLLLLQGEKR